MSSPHSQRHPGAARAFTHERESAGTQTSIRWLYVVERRLGSRRHAKHAGHDAGMTPVGGARLLTATSA